MKQLFYFSILSILFILSGCRAKKSIDECVLSPQCLGPAKIIKGDLYYPHVFGMPELQFKQGINVKILYKDGSYIPELISPNGYFSQDENGDFFVTNGCARWNAGQFKSYRITELRKKEISAAKNQGKFSVVTAKYSGGLPEKLAGYVDVFAMQWQSVLKGEKALFLAASGYDAIEAVDMHGTINLDDYRYDHTQGPAVSLGCFGASALRFYSQALQPVAVKSALFDAEIPHIQLLRADFLDMKNGYPLFNKSIGKQNNVDEFLTKNHYDLSVLYHQHCDVTARAASSGWATFTVSNQPIGSTVDQIFAAGLSLGFYKLGLLNGQVVDETFLTNLAKRILADTCEAVVRLAIEYGREKVYIWALGCGVFGNKRSWFADALLLCEDLIKKSGCEFILVSDSEPTGTDDFNKKIKTLCKNTGGKYLCVSMHGKCVREEEIALG